MHYFEGALQIDPKQYDLWFNIGLLLANQGRYREAIDRYEKAIDLFPAYAPAWNNLGAAQDALGLSEDAIASYIKALSIDPNLQTAERYLESHQSN